MGERERLDPPIASDKEYELYQASAATGAWLIRELVSRGVDGLLAASLAHQFRRFIASNGMAWAVYQASLFGSSRHETPSQTT